ncbi:MAG: DUF4956 domain-containing protein [Bacteroidaceae bacterium]|nr:DUF4956 domain-containing protein [Bacteroidaceae bacterium]
MYFLDFTITADFWQMLLRFAICMLVNWVIIDRLYYAKSHRRDFYFTFMLISVAIFFLVFFMVFVLDEMKGKTGMGVGIGLFGIFSIMRYRTDAMPVREMTYLFLLISLSVLNALAESVTIVELLVTNVIVIICVWMCELKLKVQPFKLIQYDRIDLIKPSNREDLIDDLERRFELKVLKVEVGGIDTLRDMAVLKVYYQGDEITEADRKLKLKATDY